jgi:hypothetical protein
MAPTTTPTMTVLHLESGHVLAAVSSGSRAVTVDDLTGGTYLAVRLPGSGTDQVKVTANLLTATSVPLDDEVLSRPLDYQVADGVPPLAFAGAPIHLDGTTTGKLAAPDGAAVTSLWRVGDGLEVARGQLKDGVPEPGGPPGATQRLVACKDEPLAYED